MVPFSRARLLFRKNCVEANVGSGRTARCAVGDVARDFSRARDTMGDKNHRRPGGSTGGAPIVRGPMPRSVEATNKLWRSLQETAKAVTPQVTASLASVGSHTKEVWLDPLREITRDIAGDVREVFRPGGAGDAHAALRASANETRGAVPRNVASASRAPAATKGDAAAGAPGGFRGGSNRASTALRRPFPLCTMGKKSRKKPSPTKPPSAAERLDSIFASLDSGAPAPGNDSDSAENDLDAAERGGRMSGGRDDDGHRAGDANTQPGVHIKQYGEITEITENATEEDEPGVSGRLLRDETADAFSKLSAFKSDGGWCRYLPAPVEKVVRYATATPGATVAVATIVAMLLVLFIVRDHSTRHSQMVDTGGLGGEEGGEPSAETPPSPLPE